MIRSEALKIQRACPGNADIDRARSFCHTCDKAVHDLSTKTESEVDALLESHAGHEVCVSYRVDRYGEPIFKGVSAPTKLAPMVMALALVACTPWGLDEPPTAAPGQGGECVLVEEGVWECVDETLAPVEEGEAGEGCETVPSGGWALMGGVAYYPPRAPLEEPSPPGDPKLVEREGEGPVVRVNFEIDPESSFVRGMVVSDQRHFGDRLRYTPTAELIEAFKEKRAVRAAQRKARKQKRWLTKKD